VCKVISVEDTEIKFSNLNINISGDLLLILCTLNKFSTFFELTIVGGGVVHEICLK